MNEKTSRAKSPITLRRVLTTAAVLLLFALVFVVPAAADGTSVSVSTQEELNSAITNADKDTPTIIILTGDYYTIFESGISSKNITFKGSRNTVLHAKDYKQSMLQMQQSTFIFEGVTVRWFEKNGDGTSTNPGYQGFTHTKKVVYRDCLIEGCQFMYATEVEFINCEFKSYKDYAVYCRAMDSTPTVAQKVKFEGCTFYTGGKAIMLYNDKPVSIDITLIDCNFYSDKSLATDKAAVETGDDAGAKTSVFKITIEDCTAENFAPNKSDSPLWGNKNEIPSERLTVTVTLSDCTVTWKVEGEDDKTVTVQYGQKPDYGDAPTRDSTPQTSYTFEGWVNENGERFTNENLPIVREDVTYTAVFTETQRTYTVLWTNETGFELEKDENVPYGATPSFDGTEPQKAEDEKFTYSFAGWSPKLSAVEGDITYKATYTEDPKEYTITLNTDGGNTLEKITQDYGTAIKLPIPTKEGHLFKGWTPKIPETMPANDLSFTAQWAVKEEENTGNAGNTETTEKPGETTPEVPGELKPETDGTLTFVPAASADVPTFETSEDGTTSVTIASEDGVTIKLKATTGEVTSGAGNSVTGTFDIVETTINKPATLKGSEKPVSYDLVIPMDADKVLGNVPQPAINAEFNAETGNKVANHEGNSYNALAMIQASYSGTGGIDTINSKITGEITLTFTLPATYGQKLVVFHVVDGKDPVLLGKDKVTIAVDQVTGEIIVTAKGTGFSSYVVAQDTTPTAPTGGSSTPQGSSVWLTESQTPTQTPSEQPTTKPTDSAPTDVPTTQPTQTETQSPLSVLAVLAGLGAVAVLRRK